MKIHKKDPIISENNPPSKQWKATEFSINFACKEKDDKQYLLSIPEAILYGNSYNEIVGSFKMKIEFGWYKPQSEKENCELAFQAICESVEIFNIEWKKQEWNNTDSEYTPKPQFYEFEKKLLLCITK